MLKEYRSHDMQLYDDNTKNNKARREERGGLPTELIVACVFRECCSDREGLRLVH